MKKLIPLVLALLAVFSCKSGEKSSAAEPAIEINVENIRHFTADLKFRTLNLTSIYLEVKDSKKAPTAAELIESGVKIEGDSYAISNLEPSKKYWVFAVGVNEEGKSGRVASASFTTMAPSDKIYSWEESRKELPDISDMMLLYGGSAHREPRWKAKWPYERLVPYVTCKDAEGNEQWLFESFLAIEFADTDANMTLWPGPEGTSMTSADKASWQRLIDYWFEEGNGFDALDKVIEDAAKRIGAPKSKRFVIMVLPEAMIYHHYADKSSSTKYWGELEGRQLDFSIGEDRRSAQIWYINEVRRRFDEAKFKNLELVGFYVVSEDIAMGDGTGDPIINGWCQDIKRNEELFPAICDYLHAYNEGMYWIPYYEAAPYTYWKDLHIDWAVMQPNIFWLGEEDKPWSKFFRMISESGMGMEIEFDDALLAGQPNPELYRTRLRAYLANCKKYGVYGYKPLGVYGDNDTLYKLWESNDPEDQQIYRELCDFFLENPRKKF